MGRVGRSITHRACTRCTETIRMQNKEEISVVVVEEWFRWVEGGRVQQLKCIEEEWCIEGTWCTEHKR
jgi:hypothetical protein